ncbi:hypothetical protein B0H14DRAFT_3428082 [Mycena olivaceomarginata]|nr:hypothetical protein B0H14DRAFT_3428082 [Mycena olivaceomarginata]
MCLLKTRCTTSRVATRFERERVSDGSHSRDRTIGMLWALGYLIRLTSLLLEHGADTKAEGGLYGSTLQAASSGGNLDIVQLLLEHGADVKARGGAYGTALHAASLCGVVITLQEAWRQLIPEVVPFLLWDMYAGHKEERGWRGSALEAAYSEGHTDIVELLEKYGAVFDVLVEGDKELSKPYTSFN